MKGLMIQAINCILSALIPFKKATYVATKVVIMKYKNPHRESEKVMFTLPFPSQRSYKG